MTNLARGWGVIVRLSVAVAVSCLLLTGLSAADPAVAAIRKQTNISPQGLGSALQMLAKDRQLQVLYRTEVVGDRQTSGAVGQLSFDEALSKLLSGTGLTFQYLDDKTVTIVPVAAAARPQARAPAGSEPFWGRFRLAQVEAPKEATPAYSDTVVEEVIVTAQKRAERLQDVPMSISVLGGEELDKSTAEGVTEMLSRVAGVSTSVAVQGAGTQIAVRGVTASGALFTGSNPVGFYLDAAPFGLVKSAIAPDANAYDLDRIEVLRGPQGTLYGASAQTGVVRLLTRDADLNEFDIKARTSGSSTETGGTNYRGDMAVNLPIVEGKLAARAVVGYQHLDGWIDKPNRQDANDADVETFRLKVNAQPTESLSLGLSAWLSRGDYGMAPISADGETYPFNTAEPVAADYDLLGLKVGYDFERFSLISATSYLDYQNDSITEFFGPLTGGAALQALRTRLDSEIFSQEFTLNSSGEGPWRWTLGGIYRDGEDTLFQNRSGYVAPTILHDLSKSYAAFGELSRKFLDGKLELTGGLRYFHDEVTNREASRNLALPPGGRLVTTTSEFEKVSPRVVLTFHPGEQATLYASYSEGFRSGFPQNGAVLATAPQFPPLEADNLKNYELGTKGRFADGKLSIEAAVFYIDWQDIQQTLTVNVGTPANPINVTAPVNGEAASGMGAETSLSVKVFGGFDVGVNLSWNDITMDADVVSSGLVLFPEGGRLQASPEYTAGAFVDYAFSLGGGGFGGRFSTSANYTSAQEARAVFPAGRVTVAEGDALLVSRASFALEAPENWTATLFVDNLTDEDGVSLPSAFSVLWSTNLRPRTVGLQVEYRFGRR